MNRTCAVFCLLFLPSLASAQGVLRGIVHDPQHRPLSGAGVAIHGAALSTTLTTDANGEFQLNAVPDGNYDITVSAQGFQQLEQHVTVSPGKEPVLHLQLQIAPLNASMEVTGAMSRLDADSSTVQTLVTPQEIARTPGADQTNSLAMITDFTPGAYMVHDMLHMRGGHQVSWFLDGIPVINTSIAANVAPFINPKNVEDLEVERGGYSSEYGDRSYGFFNVVTPSGFERNNQGEIIASAGNFYSTDNQINWGSHTRRFAYFASIDGSRSDLGLAPPVSQVIHDRASGIGGFFSLFYNPDAADQLRWIGSLREDRYQVPNDPDSQDAGIRDQDREKDLLAGFHWTHSFPAAVTLTVAPYVHFNSAQFAGGPNDTPFVLNDNGRSTYVGGRSVIEVRRKRHTLRAGVDVWGQFSRTVFGLAANPGTAVLNQQETHRAASTALFVEDQYQATSWLTFDLGVRLTHYNGLVNENAADPRLGAAIRIPRLNWTLHGYYAYYYQPPPLDSLAGPALQFTLSQGFGFIPLRGERDIQHDVGLTIPFAGWSLDLDTFHTSARNFLDHDVIGDSGIFVPLTDLGAIVSGREVTVRSPRLFHRAQWRVAYSNQIGHGIGPITGGLLEDAPMGRFLFDHDQRHTLSSVLALTLPGRMWATPAYQFGSGFLNGNGPAHLPPHSTFDLSVGRPLGENWTVSGSVLNIANTRYLLDTSNTFGGTHYVNPRQAYLEIRYRFHL